LLAKRQTLQRRDLATPSSGRIHLRQTEQRPPYRQAQTPV
jgi:hypothetical protein